MVGKSDKGNQEDTSREDDSLRDLDKVDASLDKLRGREESRSNLEERINELEHGKSVVEALLNISASINSTFNLQEVLKRIVDAVIHVTGSERGILMLGEDAESLSFAVARSSGGTELSEKAIRVSTSVVRKVAETGEPVLEEDVRASDNFGNQQSIQALDLKTAFCFPLKFAGKLVGVIYADSKRLSDRLTESDLSMLNAFGAQAAVAIENARIHGALEEQNVDLKKQLVGQYEFSGMIGRSKALREIIDTIKKVAPFPTTVLIQGEPGTGKELIARAIHYNSPRSGKPLHTVNCGALPEQLLESELFGHLRGSFTDATEDRVGIFESADGGTVFLDEIAEMTPRLQAELLRTLQDGEIKKVGETHTKKVDVRIIAATNKVLARKVEEGSFRPDLYDRLNVVPIFTTPLRERLEDILPIAETLLEKYSKIMNLKKPVLTREAKELLLACRWNANVRGLENAIQRVLALSEGRSTIDDSAFEFLYKEDEGLKFAGKDTALKTQLHRVEAELIRRTLEANSWNVTKAAEDLKISRQVLHGKIRKFKLSQEQ